METLTTRRLAKREISITTDGYLLKVAEFDNWGEALQELDVGVQIIRLLKLMKPIINLNGVPTEINYPEKIKTCDRLLVALFLAFPNGLTQSDLTVLVDAETKTVRNCLTEESKGLARHFEKKKDDVYSLLPGSMGWALESVKVLLQSRKT